MAGTLSASEMREAARILADAGITQLIQESIMKAPLPRVAGLDDPIWAALSAAGYDPSGWEYRSIRLPIKGGPDLRFRGYEVEKQAERSEKPQWAELVLFAVESGGYVAVKGWHSNIDGQETFWTGGPVTTIREAMTAWEWLQLAKSFAKRLKWDVAERIGGAA